MADIGIDADANARAGMGEGSVSDFVQLMKPRVMSLVVLTAVTGMVAAPGNIHPVIGVIAILAIAFIDELILVLRGNKPSYHKEPPKTPEEVLERALASAV